MATISNPKPTTGILKYGKKTIAENKTFRELGQLQRKLITEGYEKKYFHKHYYYGKKN